MSFTDDLRSYDEGAPPADGWWVAWKDLLKAADEIDRLSIALAKYGQHYTDCEVNDCNSSTCTCGFSTTLDNRYLSRNLYKISGTKQYSPQPSGTG